MQLAFKIMKVMPFLTYSHKICLQESLNWFFQAIVILIAYMSKKNNYIAIKQFDLFYYFTVLATKIKFRDQFLQQS